MTNTYVLSKSAPMIQGMLDGIYGGQVTNLKATATELLAREATVTDIAWYNPNSAVAYLQLFDVAAASSVTLGSTTATFVYALPGSSTGVLQVSTANDNGVQTALSFTNGICLAFTTSSSGSSALGAGCNAGFCYFNIT